MRSPIHSVLSLVLWALPAVALAWPVDQLVDLRAGEDRFVRAGPSDWVDVEDPAIATAERFETGELLLTGKAPGATLVMFYGQGRLSVWRVRVVAAGAGGAGERPKPPERDVAAAKKVCPGLTANGQGLAAHVGDERCRKAVLALLQSDAFAPSELELEFELSALQEQLRDIGRGLEAAGLGGKVEARYRGAGLELTGTLGDAEHRRALWEVFKRSAGRVSLEDRIAGEKTP